MMKKCRYKDIKIKQYDRTEGKYINNNNRCKWA